MSGGTQKPCCVNYQSLSDISILYLIMMVMAQVQVLVQYL